eukprot:1429199-Rhodomonas_salina.2
MTDELRMVSSSRSATVTMLMLRVMLAQATCPCLRLFTAAVLPLSSTPPLSYPLSFDFTSSQAAPFSPSASKAFLSLSSCSWPWDVT